MKRGKNLVKKLLVMALAVLVGMGSMPMGIKAAGESISLPATAEVKVGETISIAATTSPDPLESTQKIICSLTSEGGGGGEWSTSDGSKNISFKGTATGTVKMTAKIVEVGNEGNVLATTTSDCVITVSAAPPTPEKKISLSPNPVTSGGTIVATLTGYDEPGPGLSWKSDNESIVRLQESTTGDSRSSQSNTVIVVGTGKTKITVTDTANSVSATCDVDISEIPATGIALDATTGTIDLSTADKTITVTAELTPATATSTITWTSSDPSVATVAPASQSPTAGKGSTVITGKKAGTATITATANGKTATYVVTVKNPVTAIAIEPATDQTITVGDSITFNAKITPTDGGPAAYSWAVSEASGTHVTYTSSSTSSFTIKGAGVTTTPITVTVTETNSGKSATVKVNVAAAIPITGITFSPSTTVKVTKGYTVTVNSTVAPTNATTKAGLKWSISDPSYASIAEQSPTAVKVKGEKVKTDSALILTQKILAADNPGGSDVAQSAVVKVYDVPSLSYDDGKLVIGKMPESIYTGNNNVDAVSKAKIAIYYDGSCLYTSDAKSDYCSTSGSKSLSAASVQELIKKDDVYKKLKDLDKDSVTLQFRVYGSDGNTTNTDAYGSTDVTVYRLTVSGTGITTAKEYAVKGAEVKLTATPSSGFTFSSWSDGTTTNPRTVTVSGSNTYTATAVASGKNAANGAGANGANGAGGAGNPNLDKVPKTGEGRDVFIMWMILIISCIAVGVLLFVQHNQKVAIMKAAGMGANSDNGINTKSTNKKN